MYKLLKKNIKYIIIYIVIITILLIEFPYYIEAPGGIIDVNDRIIIETKYPSKGSLNLSYVKQYKASLITLIISLINDDYHIYKKNKIILNNQTEKEYNLRDKIMLEESYSNAIYLGYVKSQNEITITKEEIYVNSKLENSKTNLEIGDQIIEINGIKVKSKEEIDEIVKKYKIGDIIEIKIIKNNLEKIKYATIMEYESKPIIGIIVSKIKSFKTIPEININYKEKESGPSGGLMLALSIYNDLKEEDITKGRVIVGTGTIDEEGNVGSIGGVEYKLKGAVKNHADIFLVPSGNNYQEAMKLKKKKGYKIKIKGVKTFDEALEYLSST